MSTIDDLQRLHEGARFSWRKCSANDGACKCGLVWDTVADRVVCRCAYDEQTDADEWDHANADAIVALHNAWPAIHRVLVAAREVTTGHVWTNSPKIQGLVEALRALDDKEQRT